MELQKLENGYTLKMFADATNKRHDNIKRDFNKMLNNLDDDILTLLKYEEREFTTQEGNIYKTFELNKFSALLFASKFDDNLRARLIMKIEEQTEQLIKSQQVIIERQSKHRLVTYSDGTESLRKIIRTYYPDVFGEREAWRHLVKIGIVKYEQKTTYVKVLLNNDYGIQEQDSIRWNDKLCELLDKLADKKDIGE